MLIKAEKRMSLFIKMNGFIYKKNEFIYQKNVTTVESARSQHA